MATELKAAGGMTSPGRADVSDMEGPAASASARRAKRTGTLEAVRDRGGRVLYWRGKVRLTDGSRARVDIPEPKCRREKSAREHVAWAQEREDATQTIYRAKLAQQAAEEAERAASAGETCDAWYERFYAEQVAEGRSSARDARYSWRGWVSPKIGTKPIAQVTRDDIEDVRDGLDESIKAWQQHGRGPGRISGKRAMNVWSAVTSAFKAAAGYAKRRDLRALQGRANPCTGVRPPGDRDSRATRRKPFVFPMEFAKLVACEEVPLEWRELHAIAAFTYLRPGELRALRWSDVDVDHGVINVCRAWDSRNDCEKPPKTRNGIRIVPIHEHLKPLLERLRDEAERELVLPILTRVPEDAIAEMTRKHLRAAGVDRAALFINTDTTVQVNFRSWRDSGITWLAMTGLGVDKIMRRAGHDAVQTTLGYVKQAEDFTGGMLGQPFAPLPACLADPSAVEAGRSDLTPSGGPKAVRRKELGTIDHVDARRQSGPSAPASRAVDEHPSRAVRGHETGITRTEANGTFARSDASLVHPPVHPAPMFSESLRRGRDSNPRSGFSPTPA